MVEGSEITVAEARRLLNYRTDDYVLRLLRAGLIDGRKESNRWRVSRASVLAYKARVENKASSKSHAAAERARRMEEAQTGFVSVA